MGTEAMRVIELKRAKQSLLAFTLLVYTSALPCPFAVFAASRASPITDYIMVYSAYYNNEALKWRQVLTIQALIISVPLQH